MRNIPKYDDTENIKMENHVQAKMNPTKFIFCDINKRQNKLWTKKGLMVNECHNSQNDTTLNEYIMKKL